MKMFSGLFQKRKKVYYSCVVDHNAKYYWQVYIFLNTLLKIAKVPGKNIFVHMIGQHSELENFLEKNAINKIKIEPWGDHKYCNKLQQLETNEFLNADYVWLCDTDLAFSKNIDGLALQNLQRVCGKIVDLPNPSLESLKQIYDYFAVSYPPVINTTMTNDATFEGNFNGGLYGIPTSSIFELKKKWKYYAKKMLESEEVTNILGDKINHIDQISFSLALHSLDLNYSIIGSEFNFPTHLKTNKILENKIDDVHVLHYHNNLTSTGLLAKVGHDKIDRVINKINTVLESSFNNKLFWDFRYTTNPKLGSGVGSRGMVAEYKIKLLKFLGLEKDNSILDIGCGDLELISKLNLKNYTGVDSSLSAVVEGRKKFPHLKFLHSASETDQAMVADTVLCLDVLIHQPSKEEYDSLISFISDATIKRLIVSGYADHKEDSHMCFFYEALQESLAKTGQFKYIFEVGSYRGVTVFVADKGELNQSKARNDITNNNIVSFLKNDKVNDSLLLETVAVSRGTFGWYTKHSPRLYEYPWLLSQIGSNLDNLRIADFGAGVTPIPLLLSLRGADVITIDNSQNLRTCSDLQNANEWGYLDYSTIDSSIVSYNESLSFETFSKNTLDVWYSISVIEHMPATIRRDVLKLMANSLKYQGKMYLTVDLIKGTLDLWNRSEGTIVEDTKVHGTFDNLLQELIDLDISIQEKKVLKTAQDEKVDLALIIGIKGK